MARVQRKRMSKTIRLGTRGSALALAQAHIVKTALEKKDPEILIEICPIKTEGDQDQKSTLSEIGGKGVFIKAIEHALSQGAVDIAVHSLKDVTTHLESTLCLAGFLKAESNADAIVGGTLKSLPKNSVVGTSSLRRRALLKLQRPDLNFVDIRGNVETRINKIKPGSIDAVILSEAGLIRLNLIHHIQERLSPEMFYPAPGQGVITLETRKDDAINIWRCQAISSPEQTFIAETEFALLQALGFDCRIPLGVYSTQNQMTIFISDLTLTKHITHTIDISSETRWQSLEKAVQVCKKFLADTSH